jgi:hypothetical protein
MSVARIEKHEELGGSKVFIQQIENDVQLIDELARQVNDLSDLNMKDEDMTVATTVASIALIEMAKARIRIGSDWSLINEVVMAVVNEHINNLNLEVMEKENGPESS